MKRILLITAVIMCFLSIHTMAQNTKSDQIKTKKGPLTVHPIQHATMALEWNGQTIYVDPAGGAEAFTGLDEPDIILITDIHGDHLNLETLKALNTKEALFVAPKAVADRLPENYSEQLIVLNNGESTDQPGLSIRAIPMYNLPQNAESHHTKGRGNGYVLTMGGKNIYIAGDTEGIPEMRSLKNIDVAFIPMNLPYTMNVEQAADAVLDFEPAIVYPYHYSDSNIKKFKSLVNSVNPDIEVRLRDWYPEN